MPSGDGPSLILVGIDEAGYGPRLGPMCTAMSAMRISLDGECPEEDVFNHNLWRRLGRVVARGSSRALKRCVPVDDSKALMGARSSESSHPLALLELGVLTFLSTRMSIPDTDRDLIAALSSGACDEPWWPGEDLPLPRSTTAARLSTLNNALSAGLDRAGLRLEALRCEIRGESVFNHRFGVTGSKAVVAMEVIGLLLREAWDQWSAQPAAVVIDRQGGRRFYEAPLREIFPDADVSPICESAETSVYSVSRPQLGRKLTIRFQVEADSTHFCPALASMTAKLVRELAMERFNRHWAALAPELKPTAGYGQDARRWLSEAAAILGEDRIRPLERLA